ncbi:hypothetical protein P7K49_028576 [Saguinus oedipus]|uniref:Uncharacterized protein n=1 Tax=Saguinus oedipus TaxID=9490 RepID=A0ABQ9U5X8_SAGOE|nr:hypothetical protein P7K49_028576 [Saguinus oedipus]
MECKKRKNKERSRVERMYSEDVILIGGLATALSIGFKFLESEDSSHITHSALHRMKSRDTEMNKGHSYSCSCSCCKYEYSNDHSNDYNCCDYYRSHNCSNGSAMTHLLCCNHRRYNNTVTTNTKLLQQYNNNCYYQHFCRAALSLATLKDRESFLGDSGMRVLGEEPLFELDGEEGQHWEELEDEGDRRQGGKFADAGILTELYWPRK